MFPILLVVHDLLMYGFEKMIFVQRPADADLGKHVFAPLLAIKQNALSIHDKEHSSGAKIREHHNATLPNISSFGVKIEVVETHNLWAQG